MKLIILTAAQATALRRKTSPTSALDPRKMTATTWALPASVIADPAHASVKALLTARTQRDATEAELRIDPTVINKVAVTTKK